VAAGETMDHPEKSTEPQPDPIPRDMTRSTLSGLGWTFLGTGGQISVQLLVLIVLARLLTPEDFGIVAAALVVVGFSAVFSQLGVGPALVQREDLRPAHLRTAFTLSLLLGLAFFALAWVLAPAFADFFHSEQVVPVLRMMALGFPVQGMGVVAESLLQRELRFRWLAAVETTSVAVGYGGIGIAAALLDFGVWALVAANLAQYLLKTVLLFAVRPHTVVPLLEKRAFAELIHFGGGHTLARISNFLAGQGDNLVVGRTLGPAALGIYGRAYHFMVAPAVLFGQVLDRVLFPTLARYQDRPDLLAWAYRRGVALIALVTLPAGVLLFVLAPEVIHVLLGPKWVEVVVPFQILSLGMLFRTSYKLSDSLVRATGAVYRRAWRQAVYAGLVITGAWVGQFAGLGGVAAGVLAAVAVNFLLMAHLSLSLTTLTWRGFAAANLPGLALALVVGVQVYALAFLFRYWELSPILVLLGSSLALIPSLLLAWWRPRLFLGADGCWLVQTLGACFPYQSRKEKLTQEVVS
jgi:O-antigen/teichoic acid export membrane protein